MQLSSLLFVEAFLLQQILKSRIADVGRLPELVSEKCRVVFHGFFHSLLLLGRGGLHVHFVPMGELGLLKSAGLEHLFDARLLFLLLLLGLVLVAVTTATPGLAAWLLRRFGLELVLNNWLFGLGLCLIFIRFNPVMRLVFFQFFGPLGLVDL